MSNNNKRRCPNCGAMMPVEVKYCRKCQARMDSPEDELPRPIRPEREQQTSETVDLNARYGGQAAGRANRSSQTRSRDSYESSRDRKKKESGSPWRAVAALALIAVVIVVAVVLVINLNKTSEDDIQQESQTYEGVYVVEADTTPAADDTDAQDEEVPSSVEDADETMTDEEDEYTAVSDVVYTTGSGVNLRTGPGTDYEVVASVSSGTELARSAITGNWSEVTYEGQICYVNNSLITTEAPEGTEDAEDTDAEDYTVTTTDATTVYVISDVNLRSGPGTSYDVVATATAGTVLTCTGTTGSWSQIEYNGQTVYAYSSYLSTTATTAAEEDTSEDAATESTTDVPTSTEEVVAASGTVYVTDGVNLRTGSGTDYDIVTAVPTGTALTRTGTTGEWTEVSYGGQTVYVYNEYISTDSTDATLSSQSGTLTIISEANVRSGPGTSYDVLGIAAVGDTLTITGYTSTNWYQVEYEGEIGYIAGNLVSAN